LSNLFTKIKNWYQAHVSPVYSISFTGNDVEKFWNEKYEKEHYPVSLPDPIDAIRELMERKALKDKDLIPAIGSKTTVSLVLNRKRALTLDTIRKLSALLSLPVEVLIQSYKLDGVQEIAIK
jgi:antitoxin component HigA of HigAB toxin-antitoxin module